MNAEARPIDIVSLGCIDYQSAWELQEQLALARASDQIGDTLLLLEHPHTYTFGTRGKREHLLVPEEQLRAEGVVVLDVDRGGDVTYHGPGQLVGYPILRLRPYGLGCVRYIRALEEILSTVAASYGLDAGRQRGYTGVWVGDEKLAAIGTKLDRNGITRHGFALNVATDLRYFDQIIPCGIRDKGVCSLESLLGRRVEFGDVLERTAGVFQAYFARCRAHQAQEHGQESPTSLVSLP
jgi:lipoyl(octanoyl) transferase